MLSVDASLTPFFTLPFTFFILMETLTHVSITIPIKIQAKREVLQADYTPLPSTVSLENIGKGEVNTPEDLVKFFWYLVGGPYVDRELTAAKSYRTTSISEDVLFAATSGRRRPAKHLQIGMAVKSLTGSWKVVTMLNRLGNCINYNRIEELETELTYNCSNANQITPSGMSKEKSLHNYVIHYNSQIYIISLKLKNIFERQLKNGNSVYGLIFDNYIAFCCYYFTIISLFFR